MSLSWAQVTFGVNSEQNINAPTRKISENFRENYKTEAYNYVDPLPEKSWLEKLWEKIKAYFNIKPKPKVTKSEDSPEYLKWILMGVGLVLIFLGLRKTEFRGLFSKKQEETTVFEAAITEEHIKNINLEDLIEKAEKNEDYRLAIRYRYLNLLKHLSRQNKIKLDPQKTNVEYQMELLGSPLSEPFKKASYYYIYLWFGQFETSQSEYQKMCETFEKNNYV